MTEENKKTLQELTEELKEPIERVRKISNGLLMKDVYAVPTGDSMWDQFTQDCRLIAYQFVQATNK